VYTNIISLQCFSVAEKHLGISSPLNPYEMKHPDQLALVTYLSYFYDIFHDKDPVSFHGNSKQLGSPPPAHLMPSSPPSRSWNTKLTLTRPVTKEPDVKITRPVTPRAMSPRPPSVFGGGPVDASDKCYFCQKKVYLMERQSAQGIFFHRSCFRCYHCNSQLKTGNYSYSHGSDGEKGRFYCTPHFKQLFLSNPEAINYGRHRDGPTTASAAKKTSQHSTSHLDQGQEDQRKPQQDQKKQQFDQKVPERNTTEAIQTKPPARGRGKVLDRIKNWEAGKVAPVDTTPPSIHDSSRIIEPPPEDNCHDNKTQEVIEQQLVCSYEENVSKQDTSKQDTSKQDTSKQDTSKQDTSKQDTSKQDTSKQDTSKQDTSKEDDVKAVDKGTTATLSRHEEIDELSEDDDVLPLPSSVTRQPLHSTPQQMNQSNEEDDEFSHRRSSRVITRSRRAPLSRKHQTTMELSVNEDVATKRATRMNRMRSIGAPYRLGQGQKSIFRRMASIDSDVELTDNKLQEHRKHYSRLLKVL